MRALCDTLAVINMGRLSDARPVKDFTVDEIGLLMGGVHGTTSEVHIAPGEQVAVQA